MEFLLNSLSNRSLVAAYWSFMSSAIKLILNSWRLNAISWCPLMSQAQDDRGSVYSNV